MGDTRRAEHLMLAGVVLAALVLRWWAFAPFDISHADEIMQYLEQGKRLVTGEGIVPWESRFGARNSLIPQFLVGPFWLGGQIAPDSLTGMHLARWTFLAATLIALPAAWKLGALSGRRHAWFALLVAAVWYECVLFSTLMLSEVLASGLLAMGAALLLADAPSRRALRWAGLLLGLGVLVRLQYAPFAAVLVLARLRLDRAMWAQLILGGLAAAALGALSDLIAGQIPFRWIYVNFAYNLGEGRAARFGESGPLQYMQWLLIHLGPLAPFILAGAVFSPPRYRPLVWALVATVLFHSLIAHKEWRFIWIATWSLLVLAAIASVDMAERLAARRGKQLTPAMLLALAALWLGASMLAQMQSGGARTLRGGSPIPLAALAAVEQGQPCGIALPDQWRAHLVPALLPRHVPHFIAPEGVLAKGEALPPGLVASADVLVFPARPKGAEAYRELTCRENGTLKACAYVRPGKCAADPYWTYQAALEREGL